MYIPWTKLFPCNAYLLCVRAKITVVHAKQYDYAQMNLTSKHLGFNPRDFLGLLQMAIFC